MTFCEFLNKDDNLKNLEKKFEGISSKINNIQELKEYLYCTKGKMTNNADDLYTKYNIIPIKEILSLKGNLKK